MLKLKANSNCWICEGWTEFKFDFEPQSPEKIDNETMPVVLHISSDKYQGELLLREASTFEVRYSTYRMLPPGEATYYYSVNGEVTLRGDLQMVDSDKAEKALKLLKLKVPKTNIIENVVQNSELITKTYLTNMTCIPRPPPKNLKGREKIKTPWDFNKSVFKDYKADNADKLAECFEFDWSCSKIEKLIKSEEETQKCKEYLRGVYKLM